MTSAYKEQIWYRDPREFLWPTSRDQQERIIRIVPLPTMTLAEQLNSVMRFSLYYGILLLILRKSLWGLYVPLLTAAITYIVYSSDEQADRKVQEKMDRLELEVDPVTRDLRVKPTRSNPFMNVLVTDYDKFPCRPEAADIQDPAVAKRAEKSFHHNLYSDQNDVFDRITNSRQFYTMPATTIPNNQGGFAEWLYKSGPSCKEGAGEACNSLVFRSYPGT